MTDAASGLPARLIQLVARFRPEADGVGETALRLADVLWRDHGLPSDFLVYNPPSGDRVLEIPERFPHTVENLNRADAGSIAEVFDRRMAASARPSVLLLHYASYGYSPQGTPFWLAGFLERYVRRGGHLLTLFHELYALPRFPSKTFFTSGIQRRIYRRILAASEAAFTSNEDFLQTMRRDNRTGRPVSLIGICSSAGEPEQPGPLAARTRRMAIFGRFGTRKRLYELHLPALKRIAKHLAIDEIADIGSVDDAAWLEEKMLRPLGPMAHSYGALTVEAASRLLEDSVVGALSYPYALRGKSSVFAAYQAHAMAILLLPLEAQTSPGEDTEETREPGSWTLTPEELLEFPAGSPALAERLQQAASQAFEHYGRHRSSRAMAAIVLPALQAAAGSPR